MVHSSLHAMKMSFLVDEQSALNDGKEISAPSENGTYSRKSVSEQHIRFLKFAKVVWFELFLASDLLC